MEPDRRGLPNDREHQAPEGQVESLGQDDSGDAPARRFVASALAHVVREGWCCRNCGGGFCLHVSPSRCPSCGARSGSRRKRPAVELEP